MAREFNRSKLSTELGCDDGMLMERHPHDIGGNYESSMARSAPAASPLRKKKNLKALSLSTAAAQKLGPSVSISSPTKQAPLSAGINRRAPMKLPALNIGLVRRPSLPVLTGKDTPDTPVDKTFSVVKELQSVSSHDMEKETVDIEAYKSGPVCVLPPNLWLYSEPTISELKEFDVVVNVAREVHNPLAAAHRRDVKESSSTLSVDPVLEHSSPIRGTVGLDSSRNIKPRLYDGVEYVHMPWEHNQALATDLPDLISFLDHRINLTNKRVLVHCQQGVSRSASLVIAYIMKARAIDVNEAYSFVKSKSSSIGPNMSLIYQLCEWGKILQKSKTTTIHRRSFDVGGAKTAPSDGSFPATQVDQRKRATSSVGFVPLTRTKSDQYVPSVTSLQKLSLSSQKNESLAVPPME